ncbi:MAG: hypothetical protein O2985_06470 [Proteobacteria bacterium]|nr:hypothetical protein [Pseudomonadota bacterium]
MIQNAEYDRLVKLFRMLSNDNDGEVLNAVSAISRILNAHGLDWPEIILPRKLLPVRVDPTHAQPSSDTAGGPKPLSDASPKDMLDALMASPNVDAETRRDLRDYARALTSGRLTPSNRADLQALYNYVILSGRQV